MTVNGGLEARQRGEPITFGVLGVVSLRRGGKPLTGGASQRRNLALIAVLAVHAPEGMAREKLAVLLWPESDEASARNSLKQAVHVLRRELDASVVRGAAVLTLDDELVESDVARFQELLRAGELEKAVDLYRGPLLDGFQLGRDAAEFDHWLDEARARLDHQVRAALEMLASRAVSAADHDAALRWWVRLAAMAPFDSRYAHGVAAARLALGDPAGALLGIDAHGRALRAEFGIALPAALAGLAERARAATTPAPVTPALPESARSVVSDRGVSLAPAVRSPGAAVDAPAPGADAALQTRVLPAGTMRWGARWVLGGAAVAVVAALVLLAARPRRRDGTPAVAVDPQRVALAVEQSTVRDARAHVEATAALDVVAGLLAATDVARVSRLATDLDPLPNAARDVGARVLLSARGVTGSPGAWVLRLADSRTDAVLWEGHPTVVGDGTPPRAVAAAAAAAAIVRVDPRFANWSERTAPPSTWEAYEHCVRGMALYVSLEPAQAAHEFRLAARDTTFPLALLMAAQAGYYASTLRSVDSMHRQLEQRRLTPFERAFLDYQRSLLAADLGAEYRAAGLFARAAGESEWRMYLAETALAFGRAREALDVADDVARDPGWTRGFLGHWFTRTAALHQLRDHERELQVAEDMMRRFPDDRIAIQMHVKALAALGREAALNADVDRALTLRQRAIWADLQPMTQGIQELRAHGYHAGGQRLAERTLRWMERQPAEDQARWQTDFAEIERAAGRLAAARRRLARVTRVRPESYDAWALYGVVSAELGDTRVTRAVEARLAGAPEGADPPEFLVSRATVAMALGKREDALAFLRDALKRGYRGRRVLYDVAGLESLRGDPAFEVLIRSAD